MIPVYLVQPNYHSIVNGHLNYWLPYSVGILWSYAVQDTTVQNNYFLANMIYSRANVGTTAESIKDGAVVAFSCYVWNWNYNLTLAKRIKELSPGCSIVFGGPQVTNRPLETGFFKKYSYIDSIILSEGEEAFTEYLKNNLAGVRKRIYQSSRLQDLDIPSPYLTGLFDQLIKNNNNISWLTSLETNRGCPFQCTFCDWGSLTYSKVKKFHETRVFQEIEWMGKNNIEHVMVTDANFGIFKERDYLISKKICEVKETYGYPKNINFSFTKNSNAHVIDIVKLFDEAGLSRGLTVSFQSMDATVLKDIKRANMDINNASEIFQLLDKKHLTHYSEFILGLPSETLESWKSGLVKIIDVGQHQCIDVFHSMMLENSEMNHPSYREKYGINTVTVGNFMHSIFGSDDEIPEKIQIIRSTNTMSATDLVSAYMFSWIIVNFHCYGWTQIYARMLRQKNVDYFEFYNKLENYIIDNNLDMFSSVYNNYKKHLIDYLDYNNESTLDILRGVQSEFHVNRQECFKLIKSFVDKNFSNCITKELLENIAEYQEHFVASPNKQYPYIAELDLGIQTSITYSKDYEKNIKSCNIKLTGTFTGESEFLTKLLTWRRNGWGKAIISEKQ